MVRHDTLAAHTRFAVARIPNATVLRKDLLTRLEAGSDRAEPGAPVTEVSAVRFTPITCRWVMTPSRSGAHAERPNNTITEARGRIAVRTNKSRSHRQES